MRAQVAHRLLSILQWLARLCGLALFLLVLAIAIGEGGPPNPFRQPLPVATQLLLMPVMTLGLLIAWRWEVPGALTTLLALAAFNAVNFAASGKWAGGAFPLFAIPPVLYLTHALIVRGVAARRLVIR
jgi:hypothetical protein